MKNTHAFFAFFISFFFLFAGFFPVSAEEDVTKPIVITSAKASEKEEQGNFQNIQKKIEISLEKSLVHLQEFQKKVQSHKNIPEDKRTEYVILIGTNITEVKALKRKIMEAKNMEELKELKKEARDFMKTKREYMEQLITDIRLVLSEIDADKIADFSDRMKKALQTLKTTCVSSEDSELFLTQIEKTKALLVTVRSAAKSQDIDSTKKALQDARELLKSTSAQVKSLVQSCPDFSR